MGRPGVVTAVIASKTCRVPPGRPAARWWWGQVKRSGCGQVSRGLPGRSAQFHQTWRWGQPQTLRHVRLPSSSRRKRAMASPRRGCWQVGQVGGFSSQDMAGDSTATTGPLVVGCVRSSGRMLGRTSCGRSARTARTAPVGRAASWCRRGVGCRLWCPGCGRAWGWSSSGDPGGAAEGAGEAAQDGEKAVGDSFDDEVQATGVELQEVRGGAAGRASVCHVVSVRYAAPWSGT